MTFFRVFATWLYRRNEIRQSPPFAYRRPDEYQPTIIPPVTQDAILDAIPGESRGIFLAMFLMGIRPGEARALDCGDFREGMVKVSKAVKDRVPREVIRGTKARKSRLVPVHPDLEEWITRNVPKTQLLIGARSSGSSTRRERGLAHNPCRCTRPGSIPWPPRPTRGSETSERSNPSSAMQTCARHVDTRSSGSVRSSRSCVLARSASSGTR